MHGAQAIFDHVTSFGWSLRSKIEFNSKAITTTKYECESPSDYSLWSPTKAIAVEVGL